MMISIDLDFPRASGKTTQLIKNAMLLSKTKNVVIVCLNDRYKKLFKQKIGVNKNIKIISQKEKPIGFKADIILCDECGFIPNFDYDLMLSIGTKDKKDCYVGGRTKKISITDTEMFEMCDKHLQVDFNIFFKGCGKE